MFGDNLNIAYSHTKQAAGGFQSRNNSVTLYVKKVFAKS